MTAFDLSFQEWLAARGPGAREVETPSGNLGYGVDLWCREDWADDFGELDAMDPEHIAQALLHRLITPRGSLELIGESEAYGLGVQRFLSAPTDVASIAGQVEHECRQDDRLETVTAAVAYEQEALTIDVSFVPVDSQQSFQLVFSVDGSGKLLALVTPGSA